MKKIDQVSIVIPIYNEEGNINILLDEIIENLSFLNSYEVIIIDDFSSDNSKKQVLEKNIKNLRLVKNSINRGQSYSIYKGVKLSKYNTIITIDGDLQNDPKDIKKLLIKYNDDDKIKLVSGIRTNRKDTYLKIISSKIANSIRSFILKDNCVDTGCSLKIFDKNTFLKIPFFNGLHRFIPALFIGMRCNVIYMNVNHRHRKYGISKYSTLNRLFRGIYDIYRVRRIIKNI